MAEGLYGDAEILARAKNTSIAGMRDAGIVVSRGGRTRLVRRDDLPVDWDPKTDRRLTLWELAQHLMRTLEKNGESSAGVLLSKLGGLGDAARDLAYRLYMISERKGWTQEALAYNSLVIAWPEIKRLASTPQPGDTLFDNNG